MADLQLLNRHIGTLVTFARNKQEVSREELAEQASAQLGESIEPREIQELECGLECEMSAPKLIAIFVALDFMSPEFFDNVDYVKRKGDEIKAFLDCALPVSEYPNRTPPPTV